MARWFKFARPVDSVRGPGARDPRTRLAPASNLNTDLTLAAIYEKRFSEE